MYDTRTWQQQARFQVCAGGGGGGGDMAAAGMLPGVCEGAGWGGREHIKVHVYVNGMRAALQDHVQVCVGGGGWGWKLQQGRPSEGTR